ncbi:MAG: Serine acetyltransferase [Nitrospira sp.]|jgi:serine O-acetyltransferase|nr:MAG: Serine acetyltransferase [Nitrospira sp.]
MPIPGSAKRLYASLQVLVDQIHEDWSVNSQDWTMPGFRAIAVHRFGTWLSGKRAGMLKSCLFVLYHALYRYVRNHYGVEIPLTTVIGRRLWLVHQSGIVFHWKAEIGDDCLIRHNATIGAGYGGQKTLHRGPKLGHRVEVGTGAVIFAGVRIGDGAVIGPNAVVMSDVPAGARVFVEAPRVIRLSHLQRADTRGQAEAARQVMKR